MLANVFLLFKKWGLKAFLLSVLSVFIHKLPFLSRSWYLGFPLAYFQEEDCYCITMLGASCPCDRIIYLSPVLFGLNMFFWLWFLAFLNKIKRYKRLKKSIVFLFLIIFTLFFWYFCLNYFFEQWGYLFGNLSWKFMPVLFVILSLLYWCLFFPIIKKDIKVKKNFFPLVFVIFVILTSFMLFFSVKLTFAFFKINNDNSHRTIYDMLPIIKLNLGTRKP